MTTREALRAQARNLFSTACSAADPARSLRAAFVRTPPDVPTGAGRYVIVALGKAAVPMVREALELLKDFPKTALAVTNAENYCEVDGAEVLLGAHPIPDERSARAFEGIRAALKTATADDQVIALISGGGSALAVAPAGGISLADKAKVNSLMLDAGFDITSVNLVRQTLSDFKGGGLLRIAAPAPVTSFVLSDVIGDSFSTIASGPTALPLGSPKDAVQLLKTHALWPLLPQSVRAHLQCAAVAADPVLPCRMVLIGSNSMSLDAVQAEARDFRADVVRGDLVCDVEVAAEMIVDHAVKTPRGEPRCLIFGGETTVRVQGTGLGGRNQELALRIALRMPDLGRDWVFLSGGTDGRDGPTSAAGGIVDAGTAGRIQSAGANATALLGNNDSYRALELSGDLLVTGGTGTNVADVQILLLAE